MHIRKATADDLDALDQIMWRACWSNEADRPFLTANPELVTANRGLVEAGQTFVAEENVSVGFAAYEKSEETWELEALFVDPAFMRRGIARGLAEACFRDLRKLGAQEVFLTANPHAMGFYESVGFRVIDPAFQPGPRMVRPLIDPLGSLR